MSRGDYNRLAINEEEARAMLLTFSYPDPRTCSFCGRRTPADRPAHVCSACKTESYCDRACQMADWVRGHSHACKSFLSLARPRPLSDDGIAALFSTPDLMTKDQRWKISRARPDAFSGRYATIGAIFQSYQVPVYTVDEGDLTKATRDLSRDSPAGSTLFGVILVRYPGTPLGGLGRALEYLSRDGYSAAIGLGAECRRKLAEAVMLGRREPSAGFLQPSEFPAGGGPAPPRAPPRAPPELRYYRGYPATLEHQLDAQKLLGRAVASTSEPGADAKTLAETVAEAVRLISGAMPDLLPISPAGARVTAQQWPALRKSVTEAYSALDNMDLAMSADRALDALIVLGAIKSK